MYIVKNSEQTCSTCDHWIGTRIIEDGFVYSLKSLDCVCNGIKRMVDGAELTRARTFPNATCKSWERWIGVAPDFDDPRDLEAAFLNEDFNLPFQECPSARQGAF